MPALAFVEIRERLEIQLAKSRQEALLQDGLIEFGVREMRPEVAVVSIDADRYQVRGQDRRIPRRQVLGRIVLGAYDHVDSGGGRGHGLVVEADFENQTAAAKAESQL